MSSRWAWIAAALVMTGAAVLAWTALLADDDPGVQLRDFISTSLIIGGSPATATWLIVRRAAAATVGRGTPARLLALATAGLRGGHAAWGAAMRGQLAGIDRRDERRRFAVGRAWTALRTGWTCTGLLVAATVGAGLAATTLFSSRASLAGDRTGSLSRPGRRDTCGPARRGVRRRRRSVLPVRPRDRAPRDARRTRGDRRGRDA